jgi:sigma-E factor negative regulatory protein RseA
MVMGEDISRLMDGEIDDAELDAVCEKLKRGDAMATWVCYHVIGDQLRGAGTPASGFSRRFAARLAAEPTVLAPQRREPAQPVVWAWAAAAGVAAVALVGWVAFGTLQPQAEAMAKAGEAASIRPVQFTGRTVPADYLMAHEEFSPTAPPQGAGAHLRSVAVPAGEDRP